jgi:uncharacterized protein YihD (DUF1040 family)
MLRCHKKRPFTYDKVEKILTTWTHPDDLVKFIEETWKEMPDLGLMKLILKVAHEQIEKDHVNLPEPGMILADDRIRKRQLRREDLVHVLEAIQVTTQMILIQNREDYRFRLLAPYGTILEALQRGSEDDESARKPESTGKTRE